MDTILSLILVVLFSGWIFRLKSEIYTLERLVGVGDFAAAHVKPSHPDVDPLLPSPVHDRSVHSTSAPGATTLPPNGAKPSRKGGVQVWTLD